MRLYWRAASRGLLLGGALGVLWLAVGSRVLLLVALTVLIYSTVFPLLMLHALRNAGVRVHLQHSLLTMGQTDTVTAVLTGRFPWILHYEFSLRLPPYIINQQKKEGGRSVTVLVEADRRGAYQIGEGTLTATDPLGIFELSRSLRDLHEITVLPRLLPLQKLRISLTSPLDGQRVRFAPNYDTSQLIGTHPYANEPFNCIHWKMSAHAGHLFSKEFSPSASKTLVIVLNLTIRHTPIFDTDTFEDDLCTVAGSIARYACDRQLPFGTVVLGKQQQESGYGTGPTHLASCLMLLAGARMILEPDPTRATFLEYLQTRRYSFPAQAQLFLIQQEMTEQEIGALLRMRAQFSRVSIALFPQGSFRGYAEHRAPYFMKDYDQIERLRTTQKILRTAGIDLSIIGLNDTVSALAEV